MIPFKEVKVLDRNTEALGIPTLRLMENAGTALAKEITEHQVKGRKILILCGTGNNGGDGLVAARHLSTYFRVRVMVMGKGMKSEIARINLDRLPESVGIHMISPEEENWNERIDLAIREVDLIVDSMLGVGITGKLRQPYRCIVEKVNASEKPIISVDMPTGLGGEIAVKPAITVTFHDIKPGMVERKTDMEGNVIEEGNCGRIVVADIGIPLEAEKFVGIGEFSYYPLPSRDAHKGNNGNVLIVGGGAFTGAPALAASAALRTGSDLIFMAVPYRVYPIIASMSRDFIVNPLASEKYLTTEDVPIILDMSQRAHAVLIGPGLGKHPETMEAVQELARRLERPMVVDADAIYALRNIRFDGDVVFTPHGTEFLRAFEGSTLEERYPPKKAFHQRISSHLTAKESNRVNMIINFARTHGVTVVQKGHHDLISDGIRVKFNRTGNPGMTVGGTGDVLAGIIASLFARGLEPFNAARLGAYINGRAGDLAFEDYWYSLTASDVVERIPRVFMEVFGEKK